jgi:hypothetical protein
MSSGGRPTKEEEAGFPWTPTTMGCRHWKREEENNIKKSGKKKKIVQIFWWSLLGSRLPPFISSIRRRKLCIIKN